ncbi:Beta-1,3-galactosyltransferase pvg3 [Neolecta irregularis DAH-3]|uniref:Hexosyltransferase n=1 Tax=Neolecta irregularis (strain DAH-3) TaxID=1198029 RepID=A0A1U7LKM1_NEOID|nr:Beta-1,3-galactosyltransferase pvg3 [Neolecta irregularis DAH-3]|eukprot:OLL23206.1 Beta-1,3-galactosyltransferase pvg3 [Neolecta irregularis DAH-3]
MQFSWTGHRPLFFLGVSLLIFFLVLYEIFKTSKTSNVNHAQISLKSLNTTEVSLSPDSVRIFIGIFTTHVRFGQRFCIRETYREMKKFLDPRDTVTIKFILGKNEEVGMDRLISWENREWGDIVLQYQLENVNDGKTFNYLKHLYDTEKGTYDYAMKSDDDTFLNIPALLNVLRPLSQREGTYVGRIYKDGHPGDGFYMLGAGYTLSWDYVAYIGQSENLKRIGPEDALVGMWVRQSGINTTNEIDLDSLVIDHPASGHGWAAEFAESTVMVHQEKSMEFWAQTVEFFFSKVYS